MSQPLRSLHIRPSNEADMAQVARIYSDAVLNGFSSYEIDPPDEAEMGRRRLALVAAGYPFYCAEDNGEVLGYAYFGPYRARPAYRFTVEDSVYVAPQAQGRGIGRRLLARLIEEAEARDFRLMVAVVGDAAAQGSMGLHKALGFTLAGILPGIGYKRGRWLDGAILFRPLGPGAKAPPGELTPPPA